ncbi:mannonate dehydratase [Paenibacillus pasadenensis]|uniref:mannonate dehydratase n=1 Tax=Paenibacillus pasadenensis TaxID=217090 RepID=A0A2N5N2S4_9BACL|nr:mannonate dehydratase [Paenibacillus pasadenensis]PLT44623.1 Mannonate dehydratase [Paenibacillus pasadenensis]
MRLGLGLGQRALTRDNFRFARQMGCTDIVAHLTDYTEPVLDLARHDEMYSLDTMLRLKAQMNAEGVELHAIENFCPAHWHDVLLDGPKRAQQMDRLKRIVRDAGRAGIRMLGYNFSLAGVWGLSYVEAARGGARTAVFHDPPQSPMPSGSVWNFIYDPDAPPGVVAPVSEAELWDRVRRFLEELVPVAEEAGVVLAAHPDDPPLPVVRDTARLVYRTDYYRRLLDLVPSPNSRLELCLGTTAEMTDGDVYETIRAHAGEIGYVHFRNVRGKVPHYDEVFLDEGDIDMVEALRLLRDGGFGGVLIPDHTPSVACAAPWHAGMAYALGYMRAALTMLRALDEEAGR